MIKYTDSHEWIQVDHNKGIIGITFHAQDALGEIVFVELPEVGKKLTKGEVLAVLESTKAAADVYSPISGVVKEVNSALSLNPSLINHASEKEGWMVKMEILGQKELETLMDKSSYDALIS